GRENESGGGLMRWRFCVTRVAVSLLSCVASVQAGEGPGPAHGSPSRDHALAELKSYHLGCTINSDRRNELEALELPAHEKDARLIAAYRYEALGAAYWLFCAPREESHRATALQVYLASTTTLRGRDEGVPPPPDAVDGLRGCRVVYRRFVRCESDVKPYYMTVYGIIPFTVVPGRGTGKNRVKARLVPVGPPDNLRIRTEIDEGVFVALPFDFDEGKLRPHVHYNAENKPCMYGAHGETLACGKLGMKPPAAVVRVDAHVASAQLCSSCHFDGTSSMVDSKRFLLTREQMEGYRLFPLLAQADSRAAEIDLAEIRAQLRDRANTFIPPDLPRAIEEAWLECYSDFVHCLASMPKVEDSR
ncbi:MAG TPA: hypothetical protein VGY53_06615, partial [Isosphaeraceae bacterium]|nr:hypothetical protein [Isosphaeraceae bacterium]